MKTTLIIKISIFINDRLNHGYKYSSTSLATGSSYTCRKLRAQKRENQRRFLGYFTNLPKLKPFSFLTFQHSTITFLVKKMLSSSSFVSTNETSLSSLIPIFFSLKLSLSSPQKSQTKNPKFAFFLSSPRDRPTRRTYSTSLFIANRESFTWLHGKLVDAKLDE